VSVIPFREAMGERARLMVWLLMAAAAFVMIISAANVANLTLMRSVRREHELVVRTALGAGVARLRRLLLVENLMLAAAGALLGSLVALGGVRMLAGFVGRYSTRADEIGLDGLVLTFTLALSLAVALLLCRVRVRSPHSSRLACDE
jgi:ABC-type antimicrobial peptide transport system permease subunit